MTKEKLIEFYTNRLEKVKAMKCPIATIKYAELQLEAVENDEDQFDENLLILAEEYEYMVE